MAKGSVRKKGKKWYYRFYVENESGNLVQREFVGTESKSETEALLRKAMEDYEEKKFIAKPENITVGDLLDMWVEEELKPGNLSNGTVMSYVGTVARIKKHPIAQRKLKTVTADHLQSYMDLLSFGGKNPDGTTAKALSKGYIRLFSAVLQGAFRFAVFPKKLITFNPMQYVVWRQKKNVIELFSDVDEAATPTGTSLKSARQSGIKSARLISAIRWQIFLGKQKRNRRKTKRTTASFTVATFTLRSQRKTANIMRSIRCQAPRKSPTVISQSILCVCDLTVHLNHRARWEQCAEQSEKRLRVWRTSTFICFATRSQAICCQAEQHQRTCRNCSDIPTSVPQ